jgi:hypothetical protein
MRLLITTSIVLALVALAASQTSPQRLTDANQIMGNVLERDTQRELQSGGYAGRRHYIFDNDRMHKHAELIAGVTCDEKGAKSFAVLEENGWKAAHKHVLHKMLQSESETSQPTVRPQTRLTSDNYVFTLVNTEMVDGRLAYVIDVKPKREDKYLIEGRVWIDTEDFALVRAEGKPAKNPSFWTRSIHFVQQYRKDGEYWFPTSTLSITEARLFGTTKVNINYFDYEPNSKLQVAPLRRPVVELKEVSHVIN